MELNVTDVNWLVRNSCRIQNPVLEKNFIPEVCSLTVCLRAPVTDNELLP